MRNKNNVSLNLISEVITESTSKRSKRSNFTEISEKPCTDHICDCQRDSVSNPMTVANTRAHKNKVEVAVNRMRDGISAPTSIGKEPCDGISKSLTIIEPRAGTVLSEEGNTFMVLPAKQI